MLERLTIDCGSGEVQVKNGKERKLSVSFVDFDMAAYKTSVDVTLWSQVACT